MKKLFPAIVFSAAALCATAGWEDVGSPSATRRAAPRQAPATVRTTVTPAPQPVASAPQTVAPAPPAGAVYPVAPAQQPARQQAVAPQAAQQREGAYRRTMQSPAASGVPMTVREAAQRRAAEREANARAAAEREQAIIDMETRRIERRSAATKEAALAKAEYNADKRDGFLGGNSYFIPQFDASTQTDFWLHGIYLTPSKAPNGNEIKMAEAEARILICDVRDILGGDLSLALKPKAIGFIDDADYVALPVVFAEIPIDVQYVWRFVNDFSLELGATPGFYGDGEHIGADIFCYPFRGRLFYSATESFALHAGVEARPGWDRVIMPLAGLGWAPNGYFDFELGVPRSVAMIHLGPFDIYGTAIWENSTYGMKEEKDKPEEITIDDWRLGGGLTINFSESFHLGAEAGYIFNREFKAEGKKGSDTIELDDAPYFGVTLGSRF